jgi:hypothetical protein
MFRKNDAHLQPPLFSEIQALPSRVRQRLNDSWAGVFYRECFSRINEATFAVLYSGKASRPNVPVNILVGLECLKAGFGWSDEEMYDQFLFNIQVRYALGLYELGSGHFELRTLYNFRRRLVQYRQETGDDLLGAIFAQMTAEQLASFQVRTGLQRMDSSQISSNIADISRLQLVLEGVVRLSQLLDEQQREALEPQLAPFLQYKPQQFVYHIKGRAETQSQLQRVGVVLAQMLEVLAEGAATTETYQLVAQLFADNFKAEAEGVVVKANDEIASGALQSLSDRQATFRRKGGEAYKGYVFNLSQTCDPSNEFQLITHIQTAPNNVDDADLLVAALPTLRAQTALETLYTDGGFGSPAADQALQAYGVELHQTRLRGKAPDADRYSLSDFQMSYDQEGRPTYLACPQGQVVPVLASRTTGFVARFNAASCQACPAFQQRCRVRLLKRKAVCQLNFTQPQALWARRRRHYRLLQARKGNPRAAIEAAVRTIKHPFHGKLPVRGLARVSDMLTATAIMANVRSILRYHKRKRRAETAPLPHGWQQAFSQGMALGSAAHFLSRLAQLLPRPIPVSVTCFSC